MIRTTLRFASTLLALSLPLGAQDPQVAEPYTPPEGVLTVEHDAPSVGRSLKFNIVLPHDYHSSECRYPVLYLLHGLTSNYTAWAEMGVAEQAADYDLIVVMPDAGNSWYLNWAESDEGQKNAWEDYITEDLISYVDANYRTIAAREGRAINGLSMGGYGAITLGLRHPEMFCSIGSHSGALRFVDTSRRLIESGQELPRQRRRPDNPRMPPAFREWRDKQAARIHIEGFSTQAERSPLGLALASLEDCDRYDPFKLVTELEPEQLPHIYLDCGTRDRLLDGSRAFAALLRQRKIPHCYAESDGGHRPAYWMREIGQSMAVQYAILQRNLRAAAAAAAEGNSPDGEERPPR